MIEFSWIEVSCQSIFVILLPVSLSDQVPPAHVEKLCCIRKNCLKGFQTKFSPRYSSTKKLVYQIVHIPSTWRVQQAVNTSPKKNYITNIYWSVNPIGIAAVGFSTCWIDHKNNEGSESALPNVTATLSTKWASFPQGKSSISLKTEFQNTSRTQQWTDPHKILLH